MSPGREIVGFFAAPGVALAIFWAPSLVVDPSTWVSVTLLSMPVGWGIFACFGLPLHILAKRRRWLRLSHYLVGGGITGFLGLLLLWPLGFVVGLVLGAVLPDAAFPSEMHAYASILAWSVGVGAVAGGLFWAIGYTSSRVAAHDAGHT